MSDANHTPGPWRVEGEKWQGLVYAVTSEGRGSFVAEAGGDGVAETIANAQLIASAPDLLAACEQSREWWADLVRTGLADPAVLVPLDAAILKAKGGSR